MRLCDCLNMFPAKLVWVCFNDKILSDERNSALHVNCEQADKKSSGSDTKHVILWNMYLDADGTIVTLHQQRNW